MNRCPSQLSWVHPSGVSPLPSDIVLPDLCSPSAYLCNLAPFSLLSHIAKADTASSVFVYPVTALGMEEAQ